MHLMFFKKYCAPKALLLETSHRIRWLQIQKKKAILFPKVLLASLFVFGALAVRAQDSTRHVIQLTGVVFGEDSTNVIPGVHVYVPKGGRGTTTNPYGFFSLPVLEGDSIVFSSVGFKRASYVVPEHKEDHSLRVLVTMREDVTYLDELEVFPYPSEAVFKAAVLAVELPEDQSYENLSRFLQSAAWQEAYWNLPMSANMNHRFFMQQQQNAIGYRFQPPPNPLLNPFAWRDFIRSLKKKK